MHAVDDVGASQFGSIPRRINHPSVAVVSWYSFISLSFREIVQIDLERRAMIFCVMTECALRSFCHRRTSKKIQQTEPSGLQKTPFV